jgi:hypothetical protein
MMKPTDVPVVAGGLSSPVWLNAVNDWLGLLLVVLSIIYMLMRIYKSSKGND